MLWGCIVSCTGNNASQPTQLKVLPAQNCWSRKIGIRSRLEPCGKKLAQLRKILGVQWSNIAGHGHGRSAVFSLVSLVSLAFCLPFECTTNEPYNESSVTRRKLIG